MKFTDVNPFNKKIQKKINKSILDTVKKKDFILSGDCKHALQLQIRLFRAFNFDYRFRGENVSALFIRKRPSTDRTPFT